MTERNRTLNLRYRLGREPSRALAAHNQASFEKVKQRLAAGGGMATYRELEAAGQGHQSGDVGNPHAHQFIDYLIRNGFLTSVM